MDLTTVKSIYRNTAAYANKEVTLGGWIRTMRVSKNFGFIELNDGSFFKNIQIVFEAERLKNYEEISKQNVGAALIIKGLLVETPEAKQPFEVKATQIDVEGTSTPDYPLQKKRHSVEFLREIAYLRPRTNLFSATFRVRSLIAMAIHEFFQGKGFVYTHTPIITGSDCEGAGEMFRVTTLDLDILFYDQEIIDMPDLHIPHIDLHNRDFVLVPMNQIAPYLRHPVLNQTISQLLDSLLNKSENTAK